MGTQILYIMALGKGKTIRILSHFATHQAEWLPDDEADVPTDDISVLIWETSFRDIPFDGVLRGLPAKLLHTDL